MFYISNQVEMLSSSEFWSIVSNLNSTSSLELQGNVYKTFYWLNSDRMHWSTLDPINLSESFFAIANVLTFARLCIFLPVSQQLGPLQITLGKMINVIIFFYLFIS